MSVAIEAADADHLCRNISNPIEGARKELGGIREDLTRLGHLYPVICPKVTDVMHRCMTILTYLAALETTIAARRQAGKEEPRTTQEPPADYELFAAAQMPSGRSDAGHALMLASLHRAGDRTLEEPIIDRHVSVEEQEEDRRRG